MPAVYPQVSPAPAPKKKRTLLLIGCLLLVVIVSAILISINRESIFWSLVNHAEAVSRNDPKRFDIPLSLKAASTLGLSAWPDRKYILRALTTGEKIALRANDSAAHNAYMSEANSYLIPVPNADYLRHFENASEFQRNASSLRALSEIKEAVAKSTDRNLSPNLARVRALVLGTDIYRVLGRFDESLNWARHSIETGSLLWFDDDPSWLPVNISNSRIYLCINFTEDALKRVKSIEAGRKNLDDFPQFYKLDARQKFDMMQVCAEVWARAHRPELAKPYLEKAMALARESSSNDMLSLSYLAAAAIDIEEQKWQEAEQALVEAQKFKDADKSWNKGDSRLFMYLAQAQIGQKKFDLASKSLDKAETMCRSARTHKRIADLRKFCQSDKNGQS